jgi:hypothetical protein
MTPYDLAKLAGIPEESARFANVLNTLAHDLKDAAKRANLPKLYSTDGQGDRALVQMKFFTPDSDWTWFVLEFDGEAECFGLVHGFEEELGSFNLNELESARGPLGLRVERDLHWTPKPLGECRTQGKMQAARR